MARVPITKNGLAKLKEELHRLVTIDRPAITKAIAEAREHGDLRENAEFHAAKEKQGFVEGRIQEINSKLANLHVVDPETTRSDQVAFGATVSIENVATEENYQYQIVGPDEANLQEGRISFQSPIAQALIGKREGDVVKITIPKGQIEVEITGVLYQ